MQEARKLLLCGFSMHCKTFSSPALLTRWRMPLVVTAKTPWRNLQKDGFIALHPHRETLAESLESHLKSFAIY